MNLLFSESSKLVKQHIDSSKFVAEEDVEIVSDKDKSVKSVRSTFSSNSLGNDADGGLQQAFNPHYTIRRYK